MSGGNDVIYYLHPLEVPLSVVGGVEVLVGSDPEMD